MAEPRTRTTYIVECFWADVRQEQVDETGDRLRLSAADRSHAGLPVDYSGSILMPGDEVVFYVFEADSAAAVRKLCRRAGLRFERVVPSVLSIWGVSR